MTHWHGYQPVPRTFDVPLALHVSPSLPPHVYIYSKAKSSAREDGLCQAGISHVWLPSFHAAGRIDNATNSVPPAIETTPPSNPILIQPQIVGQLSTALDYHHGTISRSFHFAFRQH